MTATVAEGVYEVGSEQDPNVALARAIKLPWNVTEDGVLLFPLENAVRTRGGIIVQTQEKPLLGVVLGRGPGKVVGVSSDFDGVVRTPPNCELGDVVRYQQFSGMTIEVEHEEKKYQLVLLRFENVRMVKHRAS